MKKLLFTLFDTGLLKNLLKTKIYSFFLLIYHHSEYRKIITYLKNNTKYIAVLDCNSIGAFVSQINHYYKISKIYNLSLNNNFYFICEEKICNNFLFNKVTSNLHIEMNGDFHSRLINLNHLEFFNKKKLAIYYNNDQVNFLSSINYNISFTDDEIQKAEMVIKKLGIKKEDKLVGVTCKTSTYWENRKVDKFWDKYRISDFKNLIKSCNYLESIGYKVIILGDIKLDKESEKFCNVNRLGKEEREIIDIYIYKKLKFFINGMTGLVNVAFLFDLNILFVNYTLNYHQNRGIFLPKKFKYKDQYLSLNQILKKKQLSVTHNKAISYDYDFIQPQLFRNIDTYQKSNLTLEENTEDEILEATKELIEYTKNEYKFIEKHSSTNNKIKNIFFKNKMKFVNSGMTANGAISPNFIKKFKNYLE